MICKIMLSWFFFRQLDILRLGYLIDRRRVVWHFRAVLDLWKWHGANEGSISVLKTVP